MICGGHRQDPHGEGGGGAKGRVTRGPTGGWGRPTRVWGQRRRSLSCCRVFFFSAFVFDHRQICIFLTYFNSYFSVSPQIRMLLCVVASCNYGGGGSANPKSGSARPKNGSATLKSDSARPKNRLEDLSNGPRRNKTKKHKKGMKNRSKPSVSTFCCIGFSACVRARTRMRTFQDFFSRKTQKKDGKSWCAKLFPPASHQTEVCQSWSLCCSSSTSC